MYVGFGIHMHRVCLVHAPAWLGQEEATLRWPREEFKELSRLSHQSLRAKVHNCHALRHITITDLEATRVHIAIV